MKPQPSRRPSVKTKFRKSASGGKDRRGGGLVLMCRYSLHLANERDRASVLDEVSSYLEDNDVEEELEL